MDGFWGAVRSATGAPAPEGAQTLWALRDVSLEVRNGEVLGVIGRNGAGKSTLLKVLSRITIPTEGRVEIRGRVGSLLDLGAGFHPNLTGRDNVMLNGAILGMTRDEILRRFDAIVDFAEVAGAIDTPVKYYSSGMYVQLAFSVSAYLESEILVVDEVLAAADARFQKKCLARIEEMAQAGRAVLFASHDMAAVQCLCTSALWLDRGQVVHHGDSRSVVGRYLTAEGRDLYSAQSPGDGPVVLEAQLVCQDGAAAVRPRVTEPIVVRMHVRLPAGAAGTRLGIAVRSADGVPVFSSNLEDAGLSLPSGPVTLRAEVEIPADTLLVGEYHVATCLSNGADLLDSHEPGLAFSTEPGATLLYHRWAGRKGLVQVPCRWTVERAP